MHGSERNLSVDRVELAAFGDFARAGTRASIRKRQSAFVRAFWPYDMPTEDARTN